jgi:hypothetical protein
VRGREVGAMGIKRTAFCAVAAAILAALPLEASAAGPVHSNYSFTDTEDLCGLTVNTTGVVVDDFFPVFDSSNNLVAFRDAYEFRLVFSTSTKAIHLDASGVQNATASRAADGTLTITRTYIGVPEKWSWPGGSTITRDAGIVSFVEVLSPDGTDVQSTVRVSGPHPEVASDFALMCQVVLSVLG